MQYKILIVDDEPMLTELLADYLDSVGYLTYTAANSLQALEKLKADPDLILLDINMPGMDGLELCKTIRDEVTCPILFLTARDAEQDKINGLLIGGDDYITKPFFCRRVAGAAACCGTENGAHERRSPDSRVCLYKWQTADRFCSGLCYMGDKELHLTSTEYKLLCLMAKNTGKC